MPQVKFRFYAGLNDFLKAPLRQKQFIAHLDRRTSIKDLVESLGVPHTEIEIILVNGESVDFGYIVHAGDEISVYPAFFHVDVSPLKPLREARQKRPRFVLDCHLGRLARYLRQLGFDTLYRNDYHDDQLAQLSAIEQRILLTRDRNLLKRSMITYGYFIRETDPRLQLDEVIRRFDLQHNIIPFGRCTRCNGKVQSVKKRDIVGKLEPRTIEYYDEFWQCKGCRQVYWEGSHYHKMKSLSDELTHTKH